MTAPKLKPCPFCGGNNLKIWDNSVECVNPDCGASGPDLGHCVGAKCRIEAIAAWNTRADTATWNAAIREAAELLGKAAKNQTPARAETVKACGRAILALLKEEKE